MQQVKAVLLGAGNRGMDCYAPYALSHPDELKFVAVADPDEMRRGEFRRLYDLPEEMSFRDWREVFTKEKLADAALICTQDRMHYEPAVKALEAGYHVLLEKPMAPTPHECVAMGVYAHKYQRVFAICYVLRHTGFFSAIKELLIQGTIGKLVSIQHNENVGFWHYSHSYVRGNWRNSATSAPMILSKSCHDMDLMLWLAGADCLSLSSYGGLMHFKSENAPPGAPSRCPDGCPVEDRCAFFAPRLYDKPEMEVCASVVRKDAGGCSVREALARGPYGRCVYHCDNNVVDHQVVSLEFANGVTAVFTMCGLTYDCSRTIKLMGTEGEIRGNMEKNELEITSFADWRRETTRPKEPSSGHGGGDYGILRDFVRLVRDNRIDESLALADVSVQSHVMAFAAERSRLEEREIKIKDFMKNLSI